MRIDIQSKDRLVRITRLLEGVEVGNVAPGVHARGTDPKTGDVVCHIDGSFRSVASVDANSRRRCCSCRGLPCASLRRYPVPLRTSTESRHSRGSRTSPAPTTLSNRPFAWLACAEPPHSLLSGGFTFVLS